MPHKNPERRRQWFRDRRKEIRRIINEAKAVPCFDCGMNYPTCVMQFDHVRGVKVVPIGSATARIKSIAALHEEISKCEIVCSNCHALRTEAGRALVRGD